MAKRTNTARAAHAPTNTNTPPETSPAAAPPAPPAPATLPETPAGYRRAPMYLPAWTKVGEARGALVDAETVEGEDGQPVTALVIVVSAPTPGRTIFGDEATIAAGGAVRVVGAELSRFAQLATLPNHVFPILVRHVVDRGRGRYVVDLGLTPMDRSQFAPAIAPPAP